MFATDLEERYQRFAELREDWLLNFGYNTARAYWADLDDILLWAMEREKDPLALTDADIRSYLVLQKQSGYSQSTIRRRRTAWRGFMTWLEAPGLSGSWLSPHPAQSYSDLPAPATSSR